ncbi:oxidoreductase [Ellagibacter isourolithinifaciens]|jgi:Fe-S-cluster-containing dehydrogenase component|uniref:oxidoreductase n=1 Tax=Ellagibacter isourolithinifaciens TaxID=2137581 RepID=UPI002E75F544|nr:oxidoreductase [Ellagibacter isourolithinifaciens]MEE0246756.1 oxidoreductase [Ellagibacter isourolithinifaciens]
MAIQGILVDVDYCTGCEACVLACQQEHGYSEKEFGIKITKLGPLHIDEANKVFQYDFIPQFTQWCDLCEERCGKGKKPTCVQHCQAQCLDWGPIEELAAKVNSPKQMIVAINEA